MSKVLVESFRSAHRSIILSIDDIQISLRNYNQAMPKLQTFGSLLLAHFGRQNTETYERIRRCVEGNREGLKMMDFLEHDLKDIKIKYLLFAEKHSGDPGNVNERNFIRDFREFSSDVINRIKIEEDYLLPLIERLPASK